MTITAPTTSDRALLGNILKIYQAVQGTQPDLAHLEAAYNSVKGGSTLGILADNLVHASGLDSVTGDGFLALLYANVLGRTPDAAGLAYWEGRMAAGMSKGTILASFAIDVEFSSKVSSGVQQSVFQALNGVELSGKLLGSPTSLALPEPVIVHDATTVVQTVNVPTAEAHQVSLDGDASVSTLARKASGAEMIFGSGNPVDHWAVMTDATGNVEFGFNVIYRQSGTEIPVSGVVVNGTHGEFGVTADAGTQDGTHGGEPINVNRSAVSLNWVISGGPGALGQDGTHEWHLTLEGADSVVRDFKLTFGPSGEHVWVNTGTNAVTVIDSPVSPFTEQNSQNFAFAMLGGVADVQPGTYDVTLRQVSLVGLDAGNDVASLTGHITLV